MDMKKIGLFLKTLRKEKGLTQEQLAEILLVSGRTVSRWETGSNLPDLSILIQLAEFYQVEVKELLDGERKGDAMEKELKETLSKVADYNKMEKEQAAKAGNLAFGSMFAVCTVTIVLQLILQGQLFLVAGETLALIVGGIVYLGIMVYYGIWENGAAKERSSWKDFLTGITCSAIFTVLLAVCYLRLGAEMSLTARVCAVFFPGITLAGFGVLRILAGLGRRQKEKRSGMKKPQQETRPVQIFTAEGNLQANMLVEALRRNGIPAEKQDLGDADFSAVRCGMARGIADQVAVLVPEEKAEAAVEILREMGVIE